MSNKPCRFTKAEIERVIKAAKNSGIRPGRVEVDTEKIVVYAADFVSNDCVSPLDNWRRHNGEG